jgi:hypothetical protein
VNNLHTFAVEKKAQTSGLGSKVLSDCVLEHCRKRGMLNLKDNIKSGML